MAKKEGSFAGWLQRVRKTGEHSDLTVRIQGHEFNLHMLPLVNESTLFRNLSKNTSSDENSSGSSSERKKKPKSRLVVIDDLPGGPEAFAISADFCYIIRPSYSFSNIGPVRAAAEFLGMNDLVESTKKYLYANVFSSWRACVSLLREYSRVYPSTDEYIESRCLRIISAACTKAFLETKHVSVPIALSMASTSSSWQTSPSQNLKDILLAASSVPEPYASQLMDHLVDSGTNVSLRCRQSRSVREWLDYLINTEAKRLSSRIWIVTCLIRMLLKNAPKNRPWLELSSQYWCSLLEHVGMLLNESAVLQSVKAELEHCIGASLHELDDYIQSYRFQPDTLLALVQHFVSERDPEEDDSAEVEAVAGEVDGCLWGYAECGNASVNTFVAIEEAFPPDARKCHDVLYEAVDKFVERVRPSSEDAQRLWRPVDCSKLSVPVYEKAMKNPCYLSQPHVLQCVLKRHSEELVSGGCQPDLKDLMQKVIQASLKLLEENSKRSKEIKELQKQFANLVSSGLKVYPSQDSVENSPECVPDCEESEIRELKL